VRIAPRAHGIGQEKPVQPGMNDPVAGLQGDAFPLDHEGGEVPVHPDVGRLRIGRRVAERLHEQIRLELETGQFLQLVGGHGTGRVLGTHGGHTGLACRSRQDARKTARLAHDFLRQCVALAGSWLRVFRVGKDGGRVHSQGGPCPGGQRPADDEGNSSAGPVLIGQGIRAQGKGGD